MPYSVEFPVRWGDIDHARVMYYPRFYHYFHQALECWFGDALGVPYPELIIGEGIGFPSVNVETEFIAPLRFGDSMRIEIELLDIGRKSITLRYTVVRLPDEVVSARAKIKTVAVNNDSFKSITIPDEWRARFERFKSRDGS